MITIKSNPSESRQLQQLADIESTLRLSNSRASDIDAGLRQLGCRAVFASFNTNPTVTPWDYAVTFEDYQSRYQHSPASRTFAARLLVGPCLSEYNRGIALWELPVDDF